MRVNWRHVDVWLPSALLLTHAPLVRINECMSCLDRGALLFWIGSKLREPVKNYITLCTIWSTPLKLKALWAVGLDDWTKRRRRKKDIFPRFSRCRHRSSSWRVLNSSIYRSLNLWMYLCMLCGGNRDALNWVSSTVLKNVEKRYFQFEAPS